MSVPWDATERVLRLIRCKLIQRSRRLRLDPRQTAGRKERNEPADSAPYRGFATEIFISWTKSRKEPSADEVAGGEGFHAHRTPSDPGMVNVGVAVEARFRPSIDDTSASVSSTR